MTGFDAFDRRDLMRHALLLVGATVALPFGAEALAKAVAKPKAKRFLSPAMFAVLGAVADTIVPKTDTVGALDVDVPAKVDAMFTNWASGTRRAEMSQALVKIDQAAMAQTQKGFVALDAAQRKTLLSAYDIEALKPGKAPPKSVGNPFMAGVAYSDPGYAKLKELIVVLYYISEPALTQELTYEHSPGAWQPSIPVTAATRPSGGASLI
jgi:gluconate 2-dehydrogenase gamma chain